MIGNNGNRNMHSVDDGAYIYFQQNAMGRAYCVFFDLITIFKSQYHKTAVPRSVNTALVSVVLLDEIVTWHMKQTRADLPSKPQPVSNKYF